MCYRGKIYIFFGFIFLPITLMIVKPIVGFKFDVNLLGFSTVTDKPIISYEAWTNESYQSGFAAWFE